LPFTSVSTISSSLHLQKHLQGIAITSGVF
jgi:hypothetical protein